MPSSLESKETDEKAEKTQEFDDENKRFQEKIKALEKEIDTLKKKIDDMKSQNQEQAKTIRSLQSSYKKIERDKVQLQTEIDKMSKKYSTENETLNKRLKTLTNDFNELKEKHKELIEICDEYKDKETKLDLGQVAYEFEAEIWKVVLPNKKSGKSGIFQSMIEWLEEHKSSEEGKKAQEKWDEWKGKLKWNDKKHRRALKCLKELRHNIAHPSNVDLELARQELIQGEYFADSLQNSCTEIIGMIEIVREFNNPK